MVVYKRVSADEAFSTMKEKRPDVVRGDTSSATVAKAAMAPASWNQAQRSARFIMTTQQVDRYGDIVVTAGGDLTEFLRNPVGLLFHQSRTWPVAQWANVEVKSSTRPARMEGDFVLLPEGGPIKEVDEAAWMIENGGIRACSIGFIPDWDDIDLIMDDDEKWVTGYKFNKWELTECSVCAVPANAGALVKSAHGDTNLAKELLEDVLDNWVKTPEGLILSKADFEERHKEVSTPKTTFFVSKDFLPEIPKFVAKADMELKATTDEEAAAFVGAKVMFDPAHPENKEWPMSDVLAKAVGQVIDSFIVDHGEKKGVHGLAVEFLTDDYSGMFRGIAADRFILAEKSVVVEDERPADLPKIEAKYLQQSVADGKITMEQAKQIMKFDYGADFIPSESKEKLSISVSADFSETHKGLDEINEKIDQTEKKFDGFMARITKFFAGGKSAPEQRVEPAVELPPLPPPTDEEISAARARAAKVQERLLEKKLINA
jgi:phage head maturation protease